LFHANFEQLLYYYALAHQNSFDVRWIKQKSIPEMIISPLAKKLQQEYNLTILGGSRVDEIIFSKDSLENSTVSDRRVTGIRYSSLKTGGAVGDECDTSTHLLEDLDGCVLALGAKGLRGLLVGSPELAKASPELTAAGSSDR